MRLRTPHASTLLLVVQTIVTAAGSDYGIPVEIQLWDTGRTPLAHMVDVTNEFGLKVLAEHNFLNDNNIAFSPYGLTGILVALYEGVDGEASYQIQRGMQLPWNRNIMRVGFRDIHRTLKTYFVPEEGFLAGLALNNENVTFNDSYKKVLRFYGFDLENEQLPTLPPKPGNNDTTNSNNTTTVPSTGDGNAATTASVPPKEDDSAVTPEREETTPQPSTADTPGIDIRGPNTTPASPSSAPNAVSTTPERNPAQTPTTERITTTETSVATLAQTTSQPFTTIAPTVETSSLTETPSQTTIETTTTQPTTSMPSTVNNAVEILTTPNVASNTAAETVAADSTMSTTTTAVSETVSIVTETTTINSESSQTTNVASETTAQTNESTLETLERRKKSIVDFIFMNPPYIQDLINYRSFDVGPGPELDPKFGDKMFLANGLRNVQVSYMQYDTILDHAYLPHLEASALRLPLDSDRYYLLVVLPSRGGAAELGRLIARMARESDLRDVHAALRPKRVRAIVPSFTVKGHVTLTTDLQKLGIRDVFEPRQRDFTPMTPQAGVYVRSVEQAVTVAIRKYRPDDNKGNRYVTNIYPVHFSATYPFVYFVMDSSIHVALMAGKMVDPLNSRIL